MGKEIKAKEVYAFCEYCIELQRDGLKNLQESLKTNIEQKEKKKIRNLIAMTQEKIDFLENTKSIVRACYDRTGKKFEFNLKKHNKFLKKVGLTKDDKK